jgi:hypothetical protein
LAKPGILNAAAELRGGKKIPRPENDSQPAR